MYDIFYLGNNEELASEYPFACQVSDESEIKPKTKMYWVVEENIVIQDYDIFDLRPSVYDEKYVHAWNGVKLVPTAGARGTKSFEEPVAKTQYPIVRTANVDDYSQRDKYDDIYVWLVDKDYQIDPEALSYVPDEYNNTFVHSFHYHDQLLHKYPEQMGGIRLVPRKWKNAELKIHERVLFDNIRFEKFVCEEMGKMHSSHDWFWVVDRDVNVHPDFKFDYVPTIFDLGKTHEWQKVNPHTGMVYDYGGVRLCHKNPVDGRPKHMREIACTQKEYPILRLQHNCWNEHSYRIAIEHHCDAMFYKMLWVIDPNVELDDDFAMDYMPTKWDIDCVHVFKDEDGGYSGVRLLPMDLFKDADYTIDDFANNSFPKLKKIDQLASIKRKYPCVEMPPDGNFYEEANKGRTGSMRWNAEYDYIWVYDKGSTPLKEIIDNGYIVKLTDLRRVHSWQKLNHKTNRIHGYGGLRLFPSNSKLDLEINRVLTVDEIKKNKIPNQVYVKEPGSVTKPFEAAFISYHDSDADNKFTKLINRFPELEWYHIKDVNGIFNAHKQAAGVVNTEMFWVVDSDAEITDDFDFAYNPELYDYDVTHVWASVNPVNDLRYGYGGVKLFPTQAVRDISGWGLDFTTAFRRFKAMPQISCISRFNTSEFDAWKAGFRECVKLTLKDDPESQHRLNTWTTKSNDEPFAADAMAGAIDGKAFATQHKDNLRELDKINDFAELRTLYRKLGRC